nr:ROK family protein [Pyrinomonadaceae bacterium]
MATLRDVAARAGVSTATVSHVINNSRRTTPETRARVEQAITELDFVPSRAGRLLALQKSSSTRTSSDAEHAIAEVADGFSDDQKTSLQDNSRAPQSEHPSLSSGTVRTLLRAVRAAQPVSRAELARRLAVNRSTITELVKPLLASGVLHEGEPEASGVRGRTGRPPIGLSFNTRRAFFIGVNIGVRQSQVGITTTDHQKLAETSFDTPADSAAALAHINSTITEIRAQIPEGAQTFIGVSVPSPVCAEHARLLYAPHLGWRDVNIREALRFTERRDNAGKVDKVNSDHVVPVVVENDATAAAMYEVRRRMRESADGLWKDFILVRAGTGIGVGLVRDGEVYRGTGVDEGLAGEFGHMTIVAGGKPCACGNRGCWERYASATAAVALYMGDRASTGSAIAPRFVEIAARAEAGERRAQSTLERVGEYLGIGIANLIAGLGVPRVVVSGRIIYGWRFLREPLHEAVRRTMVGRLAQWSVEAGEPTGAGLG